MAFAASLALCAAASAAAAPLSDVRQFSEAVVAAPKQATNPRRSYPPSCLEFPLPATPSGPGQVAAVTGTGTFTGAPEPVELTFWRQPCSGGRGALLLRVNRLAPRDLDIYLPQWIATQDGVDMLVRLAIEPNTFNEFFLTQAATTQVYVFEVPKSGAAIDYNRAFSLRDVVLGPLGTVAAYQPSAYPENALSLRITGYLSGSWYDPAHGGEGIFLEIAENPDGSAFIFYAWFTYDSQGFPYWIIGQASVGQGARSVTVPSLIFQGGGFAGNFNPANLLNASWGNVTFSFPSCSTLTLQFQSTTSIQGVPSGSGTRTWSRLTTINGLACE